MTEIFLISFFASVFIYFLFAGLVVLWYIDGKIKKEQVAHALFSCLTAWTTAYFIKSFFPTIRPYLAYGREVFTLTVPQDGAFPSMHTALAFALSVTIFMHDRKVGWFFLVGALLVGIARVMANVHYPIDIVGGAFIGTIVAVIVDKFHFLDFIKNLSPRKRR